MEIIIFVKWYIAFFCFGIIGLPLSSWLFKNWQDKGYGFAKLIGLFMVSMASWFLSSIKILPSTTVIIWLVVIGSFAYAIYHLRKQEFKMTKLMIVEEVLFLIYNGNVECE